MNKVKILTAVFLGATSFSNIAVAQEVAKKGQESAAELLYDVEEALTLQEAFITARHKLLLKTQQTFFKAPTEKNFSYLVDASKKDLDAINKYNETLNANKITAAERAYYGETTVKTSELETGPVTVESEILELKKGEEGAVESELQQKIKEEGGPKSNFAIALKAQAQKLQKVEKRIKEELSNPSKYPYLQTQSAKQDMNDLANIISSAMNARRQALGEVEPIEKPSKEAWEPVEKVHPEPLKPAHPLESPPPMKKVKPPTENK